MDNLTLGNVPPTLQELFDKDPLKLTRPEINSIVTELRRQRQGFAEASETARIEGKSRVNAKKAIAGPKPEGKSNVSADVLKNLLDEL